jgi:hypothetical protein
VIRFGPPAATCLVVTSREGALAALGHDLELTVTRFDVRVDEIARRVDASFDAASLRVVRALRAGRESPISDGDRRAIEDNVRKHVLETSRHPEVRFRSSRVADAGDGFDVTGKLTIRGEEREVVVRLRRTGDRYVATVTLDQTRWGIQPYGVMMGMIRVKADVVVRLSLPAEPPPATT